MFHYSSNSSSELAHWMVLIPKIYYMVTRVLRTLNLDFFSENQDFINVTLAFEDVNLVKAHK